MVCSDVSNEVLYTYWNRKLCNFFCFLVATEFFEECFTPILNEIAGSVQYVSSTTVILNTELNNQ